MTLEIYDGPGTEAYRSLRYTATAEDSAVYVYEFGRAAFFDVDGLWNEGETHKLSAFTVGADEAFDVVVTLISGPITSFALYPRAMEDNAEIVGGNLVITVPLYAKIRVEVNGDLAKPLFIHSNPLVETRPVGAVAYTGVETGVPNDTEMYFPPGVHSIGHGFTMGTNSTARVEGGAVLVGNFQRNANDYTRIYGHGFMDGSFVTHEFVVALGDFLTQTTYTMVTAQNNTFDQFHNSVTGITICNSPFYNLQANLNEISDVSIYSPWCPNTDGIVLGGDFYGAVGCVAQRCSIWVGDDVIDCLPGYGIQNADKCLLSSSGSSCVNLGYDGGEEWATFNVNITDCVIRALADYYHIDDYEGGAGVQAIVDRSLGHGDEGRFNLHVSNLRIEGPDIRLKPFIFRVGISSWGTRRDQKGQIYNFNIEGLHVESEPTVRSDLTGTDSESTPHDIYVSDFDVAGIPVSHRIWNNYVEQNQYPWNIYINGRAMTTAVDICNLALSYIGDAAKVTGIAPIDGSAQSRHCARFYQMALDALLESHCWNFALRRETLTATTVDSETPSWDYSYDLPADMLKPIAVIASDGSDDYAEEYTSTQVVNGLIYEPVMPRKQPMNYALEQDSDGTLRLYTDQEDAVLRYQAYVTDPNQFPPLFVEVLAWKLASMLAGPIIKGKEGAAESQRCMQMMERVLGRATVSNANQRQAHPQHAVSWIQGR